MFYKFTIAVKWILENFVNLANEQQDKKATINDIIMNKKNMKK